MYVVLMNLFVNKMVAAANSSSVRAKCDPAWDHVTEDVIIIESLLC